MRQKSNSTPASSETLVRNIRRATRKHHAAEEKIRIVLDGIAARRDASNQRNSADLSGAQPSDERAIWTFGDNLIVPNGSGLL